MKIDAHMHVNYNNNTAEDIITYLDKNKFDCCWLMTWEEINPGKWEYEHLSIEDVYETYVRFPERIIPMYAPDPLQEDAKEKLKYWVDKGIKGCAELKVALNWQSDKLNELLLAVSELRLPLLFHMQEGFTSFVLRESDNYIDNLYYRLLKTNRFLGLPKKIANILVESYEPLAQWKRKRTNIFPGYLLDFTSLGLVLNDWPNINFIGHGPLFWKHISSDAISSSSMYPKDEIKKEGLLCEFLRCYPNLYADISATSGFNALDRDQKFAQNFISEFSI